MKTRIVIFIVALFNCTIALALPSWQLSSNGLGPIKIGMTLSQVQSITHQKLANTKPDKFQAEDESCFYSQFTDKSLAGISLMVSYKKIVRIDITSNEYATTKGIRIGDSESEVLKNYPGIKVIQHHYDQKGHYLTYPVPLKDRGIRFETSGGKVSLMYAGQAREIQYVEACV